MEKHIEKIQKYLHSGHTKDMGNRIERLRKYIDASSRRADLSGNYLLLRKVRV